MDIKGFKTKDGEVHQYDYNALANKPSATNGPSATVELDTTLTQSGKAADAKAVGDKFAELTGTALIEPAWGDTPKIFFGAPLQQTKDEIVCEFWYFSKTLSFHCYAKIKAQGNSTMNWPKKNQTVKLFKDAACEEKFKVDFRGWGKQNKFVIKANWRDLTHVRDIVSVRLEGDCMKSNPEYDELPELLRTSPNLGGIDGFPVLVYADGIYQGRYMFNIPKDKWMANMDDDLDEHCILCSEDYNSSCFRAAANINGNDWTDEIHDTVPASIKTRWNEVIAFVRNSSDEEFVANLDSYIKVSTIIDRHIMGMYSCDYDGYGKNQLYLTYDGQQWYAGRYDKDGTWGGYYTGEKMLPSNYGRNQYEDMISGRPGNLLFIRLVQNFWKRIQDRWDYLKVNELSIPNTLHRFRELYDITPPYLIEEDYASTTANGAFTAIPNKTTCTIQQIEKFVVERHAWMDEYMASLTPEIPVPCEGISLDKNTLTFTGDGTQNITATVIPDGCTDSVVWACSHPAVAVISVEGNVCTVEAIANGNATITATCGDYSASCTVAVSGIAEPVPCTGITLDYINLTFTEEGSQTLTATVTPTNTTDKVVWSCDNTAVATVEDGVVTAVADGSATITAICGGFSASCAVTVSGVGVAMLYNLAEPTTFDGTYAIDTGVKLFDTAKDFTILIERKDGGANAGNWNTMFHCSDESITPVKPGVYANCSGSTGGHELYGWTDGTSAISRYDRGFKGSTTIAIVYEQGVMTRMRYVKTTNGQLCDAENNPAGAVFVAHDSTLVIGGARNPNVGLTAFWNGTIDQFKVYGKAFTENECNAWALGVDSTLFPVECTWSDIASYSINKGSEASGTNYVTRNAVEIPENATHVAICNTNGSTFRWQGVALYDENMTFIGYNEGTAKSTYMCVAIGNAKYAKFSAFPNDDESNVPATGLEVAFIVAN